MLDMKLTLIAAPGGFRKTTLVAARLKQVDHPAVRLSLDKADNNLPRFPTYLAAAIQRVAKQIGAFLLSALKSPQLPAIKATNTNASHN